MTTGQLIKDARKNAGLTQAELAKKLGVPYQSISQWERDIRNPKSETLKKIAEALDVTLLDLSPEMQSFFDGFNRAIQTRRFLNATTEEEAEAAEDAVLDILHYFDELSPYYQDRAVACVRAMAGRPLIIGQEAQNEEKIIEAFLSLNIDGQNEAVKRVEELTEIPKYQKTPENE